MREIKFRAWDLYNKEMIELNDLETINVRVNLDFANYEIMQYAGLKDKNGKEIYEMDILKIDWGEMNDEYIRVNCYDKPFVMEWREYGYPPFTRYLPTPKYVEIIGNIYENPELLNTNVNADPVTPATSGKENI